MQIQFLNAPEFVIDSQGTLQRSGCWLISADDSAEDISELALEWAGNVGDAWKKPNADGSGFTPDDMMRIDSIRCQALDSRNCKITFTAVPVTPPDWGENSDSNQSSSGTESDSSASAILPPTLLPGSYKFERRKDLSEYHTGKFIAHQSYFPDALPAVGDIIEWANENCRCESVNSEYQKDDNFIFTVTAVNVAVQQEGLISMTLSADNIARKTGKWLITPEAVEKFLADNALHRQAAWAGENYYISNVQTEPADSANRIRVTLQARQSSLKMLENLRNDEITSIVMSQPQTLSVWKSRWQAGAEDQELFNSMLGSSAAEWTGDERAIVCKISPKRISDCEFEYQLEARHPEDISTVSSKNNDDDLPDRKEYYTRVGEMRFSPLQCGYTWRSNGVYTALNNWIHQRLCPLSVVQQLPQNWINQPVKLLEIVEVSFLSGTSRDNIKDICSWFNSQRVENTTLAGISGCFLRYDLDVDDMLDSRNRQWTRITRVYRKSPDGFSWNSNYWI